MLEDIIEVEDEDEYKTEHEKAIDNLLKNEQALIDARDDYFLQQLKTKGLEPMYIEEGSGNCMFGAVSHILYGSELAESKVRKETCDFMEVNQEFFTDLMVCDKGFDFARYIQTLQNNGRQADTVEIAAIAHLYGRDVEVYNSTLGDGFTPYTYTPSYNKLTHTEPIRLWYVSQNHYNALINSNLDLDE